MKQITLLLTVLVVSSCASAVSEDISATRKRIVAVSHDLSHPPQAKYAMDGVRMSFTTEAVSVCPNGYSVFNERYIEDTGEGDSYEWIIDCN